MILDKANIFFYLLRKGLLQPSEVMKGNLVAIDLNRRNRNIKVLLSDNTGFFIKQGSVQDPTSTTTLKREATCYWLATYDSTFAHLKELIPKFSLHDEEKSVLVIQVMPQAITLTQYHQQQGKFDLLVAESLGVALGTYHKKISINSRRSELAHIFPGVVPWILSYHRYGHQFFSNIRGGNQEIMKIINQFPDFAHTIDALQADWQYNGLIHGDMKWDNILVYHHGQNIDLRIVDWELSDVGDTRWDVGAVLQTYLSFWIINMPQEYALTPQQQIAGARYSLEDMQPALQQFWMAYAKTLEISAKEESKLLEQSMKYAAARMIHTAFEYLQYSDQMTLYGINLLQLSMNILNKPKEAIRELIKINV